MRATLRLMFPGLALALTSGCLEVGEGKDPKVPGDPLGEYHVVAQLTQSSCGAGALGSTDQWEFDVRLSRLERSLYWLNGREAIWGEIAADDVSFQFDTGVVVQWSEPRPGHPGCSVGRVDQASGILSSPSLDVRAFEGRMRFGYFETSGSDCAELTSAPGGLSALPCEMNYALSAERSAAPEDLP